MGQRPQKPRVSADANARHQLELSLLLLATIINQCGKDRSPLIDESWEMNRTESSEKKTIKRMQISRWKIKYIVDIVQIIRRQKGTVKWHPISRCSMDELLRPVVLSCRSVEIQTLSPSSCFRQFRPSGAWPRSSILAVVGNKVGWRFGCTLIPVFVQKETWNFSLSQ